MHPSSRAASEADRSVNVRVSQTSRCGIDVLDTTTPMAPSDGRSRVGREKSLNVVAWTLVRGILP
jgi:hypothetical protein